MTAPAPAWSTLAYSLGEVDGDTIDVAIVRRVRVRVRECWAPESRTRDAAEKERGLAAKRGMAELVPANAKLLEALQVKPELIVTIPTDESQCLADVFSFGRVLGDVHLADGRSVAGTMVRRGLATREKEPDV